jgi:hypothetical protein
MSHLLYFSSFSPEKFQQYFDPPTPETILLLRDSIKEHAGVGTVERENFQRIVAHIEKNGLSYQGLKQEETQRLDEVVQHCLFDFYEEYENLRFDLDIQHETYYEGLDYAHFEYLLERVGVYEFSQNESYPMIKVCTNTRRYKEEKTVDGDDGYDCYMIFNHEELIQLQREVESILENGAKLPPQRYNEKGMLETIHQDLLSPVKKAIQENRWLYGNWE